MKRVLQIFSILSILALFSGTAVFLYQKSEEKPKIYKLESPYIADIIKKTVATGSVVPRKEVVIKPQVSGVIETIYLEPGTIVEKGDLIAKVKIIPNMISLNDAETRLRRAKIALEDAKKTYTRERQLYQDSLDPEIRKNTARLISLNAARSRLKKAKLALEDAKINHERQKKLQVKSLEEIPLTIEEGNPEMIKLNGAISKYKKAEISFKDAENTYDRNRLLFKKALLAKSKLQESEVSLNQAKEGLKEAEKNLRMVRKETLENSEKRVQKTELSLNQAKEELKEAGKNLEMVKANVIKSLEESLQKAELVLKQAKTEFTAAKDNYQLITKGVTDRSAETSNTLIRSTIDGMILDIPIKEGMLVTESNTQNVGTTVATIADMSDMIFKGTIDESEVGKIENGMNLILSIGAIEKETFNAELEFISPKGNKVNGTTLFDLKAKLELSSSTFVRAGYSATADIVLEKREKVLAINEALLQFDGDEPFVEVENSPQQFSKRKLKVGLSDGLKIEVLSGLTEQDKIKVFR